MEVTSTIVTFRIDINFEGCDVDMVLKEMMARGVQSIVPSILCDGAIIPIDKKKLPKTPTEASVDFALHWLWGFVDRNEMCTQDSKWDKDYTKRITKYTDDGMVYTTSPDVKTELEEIGVEVVEICELMQGCCHIICQCDISIFNIELVEKAKLITKDVFKKFVKYYKK